MRKSGFTKACLGLSGGVDSSIVAAIAAEALGPENVFGVLMPSRYSSDHSISDAEQLATNLGIATYTVPIEPAHEAFTGMLAPNLTDQQIDVGDLTDQNLQSRIRGVILMAMANEHGWLVLTTGNKSEAAVGYSTLYGDTAGAFAVIRDVWKLTVYDLCTWRNEVAGRAIIPTTVLTKPPSAELKPDQRDDQSLPDYEILDPILRAYVEGDHTVAEILAMNITGADPETVQRCVASSTSPNSSAARPRSVPGSPVRHSDGTGGSPSSIGTADERLNPRRRKHVPARQLFAAAMGTLPNGGSAEVFGGEGTC